MFLLRSNLILILLALFTPFFYLLKVNIFEIALNDTYSLVFFLFLVALILSFLNYFSLKYLEINLNFVFTIIIFINFILSKIISSDLSFKIYLIVVVVVGGVPNKMGRRLPEFLHKENVY